MGMVIPVRRWLFLALWVGCGDNAVPSTEVVALPAERMDKLDLLFVLDNEAITVEHQEALIHAFPALLSQISVEGRPDLHIGAITPDMGASTASGAIGPGTGTTGPFSCGGAGDAGALQRLAPSTQARFLIDSAGATNHPNAIADDLWSVLEVGSEGCGFQQHLSAARAAFANPMNRGFRRDDAALGVIVLSDEDDCSVLDPAIIGPASSSLGAFTHFRCARFGLVCDQPDMTSVGPRTNCRPAAGATEIEDPADFLAVFRGQASDPRRVSFGAIIAPSDVAVELRATQASRDLVPALAHACTWMEHDAPDVADPAVRLAWLADQFGDRGAIGSICNADITPAATAMGINLRRAMGDPCIEDDLPTTSCSAVDQLGTTETALPACGATTSDCFELTTDPTTCPNATHQKLVVHRTSAPPAGTYTLLRC
jgi:hypothetical protein